MSLSNTQRLRIDRRPWVLYCSVHDFEPAVAIGFLKAGESWVYGHRDERSGIVMRRETPVGTAIYCCVKCFAHMGGRAFAEEPRPFRFMEADFILAQQRIDRVIQALAYRAEKRLYQLTPTEMREHLEVLKEDTLPELSRSCPNCQAPAGEPCTQPTNTGRRVVNWVHSSRLADEEADQ